MAICKEKRVHDNSLPQENDVLRRYWQQCSDIHKKYENKSPVSTVPEDTFDEEIKQLCDFVIEAFNAHRSVRKRMISLLHAQRHEERAHRGMVWLVHNDFHKTAAEAAKELEAVANALRIAESFVFDRLAEYIGENK